MNENVEFKERIVSNIERFGYHVTIVSSELEPRYAYTIGLNSLFNFEMVFAGGIYYLKDDVSGIYHEVVKNLKAVKMQPS